MNSDLKESPIAVLDANVLFSAALRDFFMHAALENAFQPRWSDRIHEEWISNLLKKRPKLQRINLERTRDLMNFHIKAALIKDYEELEEQLLLPDTEDRHVLAVGIKSNAQFIVTHNIKDFPSKILQIHKIKAISPDQFGVWLIEQFPNKIQIALEKQFKQIRAKEFGDFLKNLARKGLLETIKRVNFNPNEETFALAQ
jgi:predicted nucleic acid-binding protein